MISIRAWWWWGDRGIIPIYLEANVNKICLQSVNYKRIRGVKDESKRALNEMVKMARGKVGRIIGEI